MSQPYMLGKRGKQLTLDALNLLAAETRASIVECSAMVIPQHHRSPVVEVLEERLSEIRQLADDIKKDLEQ